MEKTKSKFMSRMTWREDAHLLSDRAFNLVLGLTLAWGFLINYILVKALAPRIMMMLYTSRGNASTIMIVFLIAYFALCLGGSRLLQSPSPAMAFLGYNMIAVPVGIVVATVMIGYDTSIIYTACLITAIIVLSMMIVSTLIPQVFLSIGRGLGTALLITIIVELVAMFLFPALLDLMDYAVIAIMSMYVGFDWARANAVQRTATNAIAVAASLYLDIVNILLRILSIIGRSKRRD